MESLVYWPLQGIPTPREDKTSNTELRRMLVRAGLCLTATVHRCFLKVLLGRWAQITEAVQLRNQDNREADRATEPGRFSRRLPAIL